MTWQSVEQEALPLGFAWSRSFSGHSPRGVHTYVSTLLTHGYTLKYLVPGCTRPYGYTLNHSVYTRYLRTIVPVGTLVQLEL
jgi:hypothetical protein